MSHKYRPTEKLAGGNKSFNRCRFLRALEEEYAQFGKRLPYRFRIDDDTFQRRRDIRAQFSAYAQPHYGGKRVEKLEPRDGVHHVVLALFATESYAVRADVYVFYVGEKGGLMAYLGYGRDLPIQVCARDLQGEAMMSEREAWRGVASCRHRQM